MKIKTLVQAKKQMAIIDKKIKVIKKNKVFFYKESKNLLNFATKNNFPEIYFWLENLVYLNVLKKLENKSLYEDFYNFLKRYSIQLSRVENLKKYHLKNSYKKKNKVLFFIHNLDSDKAHIDLFINNLNALPKSFYKKIEVIGFSSIPEENKSKLILFLKKNKINFFCLKRRFSYTESVLDLLDFIYINRYKNIIFISFPLFFSFISSIFKNTILWSMKFDYNRKIFPNCKKIISYNSFPNYRVLDFDLLKIYKKNLIKKETKQDILYTISRLEKIENLKFIKDVIYILKKYHNVNFHYASQIESQYFKDIFKKNKLTDRLRYIGWVSLNEKIDYGSVFIDAPYLSGTVCSYSIALGIPTIFYKTSNCWLNSFIKINDINFTNHEYKIYEQYIRKGSNQKKLMDKIFLDRDFRKSYSNTIKKISEKNFLNKEKIKFFFNKRIFS